MLKEIQGFKGLYAVSDDGVVVTRCGKNGKKVLKPYIDQDGYERVSLYKDGKRLYIGVHKLVALAFLDNPEHYDIVNHIDYNRRNNRADNLEWCSQKRNVLHSIHNYRGAHHKRVASIDANGNRVEYGSISDAARKTGSYNSNICKCLKGSRRSAAGMRWEYV